MRHQHAEKLSGAEVQAMWDKAVALVQSGDYSAARLVIEKSLVSEVKALEKAIERHSHAKGVK